MFLPYISFATNSGMNNKRKLIKKKIKQKIYVINKTYENKYVRNAEGRSQY